jgi:hypothetical protein
LKRVVQVYKPPGRWLDEPPGVGDFIRGACGLRDMLADTGAELRIDVSRTEFAGLIRPDDAVFQAGSEDRIVAAREYFETDDHAELRRRLDAFLRSDDADLYLSTNIGAWDRLTLPEATRDFAARFYRFADEVEQAAAKALPAGGYEVLSVRCGDRFFDDATAVVDNGVRRRIFALVERHVLPRVRHPVVVISDSRALRLELAGRYGMTALPHRPRHGAFGEVMPVAIDLCAMKGARFLYHVNAWADWWSGFSHYTALLFRIPSMNFRAPRFDREEVTVQGELMTSRARWRTI